MNDEITIDLVELFKTITKKKLLVAGITLSFVIISLILSIFIIKPIYEATTSIIIGKSPTENMEYSYNDILLYQKSANTYVQIAGSRTVAQKTIDALGLETSPSAFLKNVRVQNKNDTQVITITVSDSSPDGAMNKANTMADCFITTASVLYPTGTVQIMDKAILPKAPVKPVPLKNAAIAFALGLMVSFGIVFLTVYMDTSLKDEKDVEKYIGLPVMGVIPQYDR